MVVKNETDCLREFEDGAENGNSSKSEGLGRLGSGSFGAREFDGGRVPCLTSAGAVVSVLLGQRHIHIDSATGVGRG
jgi:hypothetical protein